MESGVTEAVHFSQNAYNANAWSVKPFVVLTDTMYNTPCRAPGSTQVYDFKKDEVDDHYQHIPLNKNIIFKNSHTLFFTTGSQCYGKHHGTISIRTKHGSIRVSCSKLFKERR